MYSLQENGPLDKDLLCRPCRLLRQMRFVELRRRVL